MITLMPTKAPAREKPVFSDVRRELIRREARTAMTQPAPHITDVRCARSAGGIHDFYSEGDYWWPDPSRPDGLPYIRRDGESNPDNFNVHRLLLRVMRNRVSALALEAQLQRDEGNMEASAAAAERAQTLLREFFLDEATRMAPHLNFAQAIHGVCRGRGIGVIDTVHLADVPYAAENLYCSGLLSGEVYRGVKEWFAAYLGWMLTSENGVSEMNTENNHAVCFFMQAAVFARFTDNPGILEFCRDAFRRRLLTQMAPDGSFPRELARTKPYNYSAFTLDNLCILAEAASVPGDDLWHFTAGDGRSLSRGIDFLLPYLQDRDAWPYPTDVAHFEAFPVPYAFLYFAHARLGREDCLALYERLPAETRDEEALRNLSVRWPQLWA